MTPISLSLKNHGILKLDSILNSKNKKINTRKNVFTFDKSFDFRDKK
jgi:hypothetical protein